MMNLLPSTLATREGNKEHHWTWVLVQLNFKLVFVFLYSTSSSILVTGCVLIQAIHWKDHKPGLTWEHVLSSTQNSKEPFTLTNCYKHQCHCFKSTQRSVCCVGVPGSSYLFIFGRTQPILEIKPPRARCLSFFFIHTYK